MPAKVAVVPKEASRDIPATLTDAIANSNLLNCVDDYLPRYQEIKRQYVPDVVPGSVNPKPKISPHDDFLRDHGVQ
jgi:hypothetical protein